VEDDVDVSSSSANEGDEDGGADGGGDGGGDEKKGVKKGDSALVAADGGGDAEAGATLVAADATNPEIAESIATILHAYDEAIVLSSSKLGDAQATNYLKMRKNEAFRRMRTVDPSTKSALTEFLDKDRKEMAAMRQKLHHEDNKKKEIARKLKEENNNRRFRRRRKELEKNA
jgi:hypothetical protein